MVIANKSVLFNNNHLLGRYYLLVCNEGVDVHTSIHLIGMDGHHCLATSLNGVLLQLLAREVVYVERGCLDRFGQEDGYVCLFCEGVRNILVHGRAYPQPLPKGRESVS